jgi:exopolyphosphatase
MSSDPSVSEFLKTTKAHPTASPPSHVSLGNPAGDADSIISAIAVAYIDHHSNHHDYNDNTACLPIVSIPMQDLKSLRPETKYLLELAGITDIEEHLVAVDTMEDHFGVNQEMTVTLVDHNKLSLDIMIAASTTTTTTTTTTNSWTVTEILDHHLDEGAHLDTCSMDSQRRIIAFDSQTSAALVASTCTLLVERWLQSSSTTTTTTATTISFPPTLAILLLGVILLDSINLSPKAGKTTQRDILAVQALQSQTDWKALALPDELWNNNDSSKEEKTPDTTALFETLQNQKFHPAFWKGLTARQALNLDYKSFTVDNNNNVVDDDDDNQGSVTFGVSSILQTMSEFFLKANVLEAVQEEMRRQNLQFFSLMCCDFSGETPRRQLVLICPDKAMSESMLRFLERQGTLELDILEERTTTTTTDDDGLLHAVLINQGNAKASRKQVAPIFMQYFASQASSSSSSSSK